MEPCKCKRCNHIWIPRVITLPKQCPQCKSPYWNKERRVREGAER